MPGWIIQGVRGEGKSLAAVGKIKEYMLKGRPVATNLDLFLDKFLPEDNATIAYRLPDHPRLQDFLMLPPAYDRKYKGEDKNGLLVLDELGTWLNSRNWNAKDRLEMLNWLFLSRKDHWDIILLAQDHEMIDAQVRTTLCDYLVQASRSDRQKVPYLAPLLKFFGMNQYMPRIHRYHVFYGLSTAQPVTEVWQFTGKEFYDGYDTNQRFSNGMEALCGTLVDMRATYTYLPACYLTRQVFISKHQQEIERLKNLKPLQPVIEGEPVAAKTKMGENPYLKIIILSVCLGGFLLYKLFSGGFGLPKSTAAAPAPAPVSAAPAPASAPVSTAAAPAPTSFKAVQVDDFITELLTKYRPRLSLSAYSPEGGLVGNIDFFDNYEVVETYSIKELHAFGVVLLRKPYGVDLVYQGKTFVVSSWKLPHETQEPQTVAALSPSPAEPQNKPF